MTILTTVKVPKGFRVTIPKEARKRLGLEEGEELIFFTVEDVHNQVCFRKVPNK